MEEVLINNIDKLSEYGFIFIFVIYFVYNGIKEYLSSNDCKNQIKLFEDILAKLEVQTSISQKLLEYLTDKKDELVTDKQASYFIHEVLESARDRITLLVLNIIKDNDIQNKQNDIKEKIFKYVENAFNYDKSRMDHFTYKTKCLGASMNENWVIEVSDMIFCKLFEFDTPILKRNEQIQYLLIQKFDAIKIEIENSLNI